MKRLKYITNAFINNCYAHIKEFNPRVRKILVAVFDEVRKKEVVIDILKAGFDYGIV